MTTETAKVKARLATLASSVDDLDELLEPLFAQSLPESIMTLEPMQQAKLQTVLPYLIYDLIFIYLKARGVDPKSHPVVTELDRVKQYFGKITGAEKSENKEPTTKIDKEAAGRFIKNAIAQASKQRVQNESTPASSTSTHVPLKVTSKMLARAEHGRQLKDEDLLSVGEEELEEISNTDDDVPMDVDKPAVNNNQQTPIDKTADEDQTQVGKRRRRPVVDPFAGIHIICHLRQKANNHLIGYGDAVPTSDHDSQSQSVSYPDPRPQADKGKVDSSYQNSASPKRTSIDPSSLSKSQNSKKKKSKKHKNQPL
ncbi:hypothetical protein AX15_005513 [Amanita polypyramis BW_CC]|nr:hypothetical protein AX15_005513 [Amanita polypyramis BW_CC]